MSDVTRSRDNRRTALLLGGLVVGMFTFGFALVPLYGVICNALGIPTAGGIMPATGVAATAAAHTREIVVRFATTVQSDLPWESRPEIRTLRVRPGQSYTVAFDTRNRGGLATVGQAIPSVTPWPATPHLIKTECFCFRHQRLGPGDAQRMVLRFMVAPELPPEFDQLTLTYAFHHVRGAPADGERLALDPAAGGGNR